MIDVRELYPDADDGWFCIGNYQPLLMSFGWEILLQVDDKDYQGDSRVLYRDGDRYGFLQFGWGSCSGCDSLQACDSYEEVASLQESLQAQTKWFDSAAECLTWFETHDWELDYAWHADETKQFIEQAKGLLSFGEYDSYADTMEHIENVRSYLRMVSDDLLRRSEEHDQTKLQDPEKATFDRVTPLLREMTYDPTEGSEYQQALTEMKPALDHHYANNSHHPEHYAEGLRGMSLMDIVEMLVDWKAATLRHNDGDLYRSIEANQGRFGYSDELKQILINTATDLGLFRDPSVGVPAVDRRADFD